MKTSRQSEAAAERSASPSAAYMMQQDPDSPDIIEFVHRDLARARRIFFSMLFRLRRQCLPLNMCRCEARSATRSAELGNLGNRKLSIIVPKIFSNRRGLKTVKPRGNTINCQAKPEEGWADVRKARQSVMVAVISIAAAFGLPLQAEAKRPEPPPPPPTAYDDLQKIISGRSGNTGSLLESFKKTVTAPVTGIVEAVQPSLPTPQLSAPKAPEPSPKNPLKAATNVPTQANAAVQEVQKGADQAVEASPELGSSQPLLFALAAAIVGFGGYKIFTGRQGEVATKPRSAAKGVKRQVQRQTGTKRVGGVAKQAANKAPKPIRNAFQSTKAKAKQPAKKSGGGLFGIGKASSPKQAAKKIAPKATKKIQRSGTNKIGTQRAGTKRAGGTKKIGGTKRAGAGQPASRRLQLDEDTSSTLGAAGVVGLGVAVAAFVAFNLTTDDSATAQEAVKDAVTKLTDIPAAITDSGKGPKDALASAQGAAPDVKAPDVSAPAEDAKKSLDKVPNAVASLAEKAPEQAAKAAPDPVARVAEKAVGEGSPGEPAEVPAPDPLGPKTEAQPPPKQIAEAAKKEIPQAVTEVAKAPEAAAEKAKPQEAIKEVAQAPEAVKQAAPQTPEAEAIIPKTPDESLTKPAPAVERSPDTSTLRKGQVEDASRQKARQTVSQAKEQQKPTAAFEAAAKKLASGPSGAERFAKTRADEQKKFEEESQRLAQKVDGKEPQGKTSKGGPLSPAKATQAASKAAKSGGSNNGVILGGLAAAAVVGLAVAAPKDKAAGAANEAASAAKDTASSAKEGVDSAGKSENSSSGGGKDEIKDDIASRKEDAQKWISDWRDSTGGK